MDIEHLRYFKTVAEMQHITRAAEQLHITQPSLSKAIGNVEAFAQAKLFDRDKNKIYLNENGKIFLRRLNQFFEILDGAAQEISRDISLERGTVRIASSVGSGSINEYLMSLYRRYPEIRVLHQTESERDMVKALQRNDLDLAVSTDPLTEISSQIVTELLLEEEMLVLVPKEHPLSSQDAVSLAQLNHESFVMNNSGMQLHESIRRAFRQTGRPPNIVFNSSSPDVVGAVLESGNCLTLIPASTYYRMNLKKRRQKKADDRVALRISGTGIKRTLYLNYLEDNDMSQIAKRVRQELPGFFAALSGKNCDKWCDEWDVEKTESG